MKLNVCKIMKVDPYLILHKTQLQMDQGSQQKNKYPESDLKMKNKNGE